MPLLGPAAANRSHYTDTFNRGALGADWVIDQLSFALSNDALVETAPRTFAPAQMRWRGGVANGETDTAEQYAKIQIIGPLTSTPAGFMLRANAPGQPLAAHYEVHFRIDAGEWRWEYYDPQWVATLAKCPGDGSLAAQDWIGVAIEGVGSATQLSLYRWDADPDAGGAVNLDSNWGTPDCVLQSATGPFANGQSGGIRFYGADPAQSTADNWSFGDR